MASLCSPCVVNSLFPYYHHHPCFLRSSEPCGNKPFLARLLQWRGSQSVGVYLGLPLGGVLAHLLINVAPSYKASQDSFGHRYKTKTISSSDRDQDLLCRAGFVDSLNFHSFLPTHFYSDLQFIPFFDLGGDLSECPHFCCFFMYGSFAWVDLSQLHLATPDGSLGQGLHPRARRLCRSRQLSRRMSAVGVCMHAQKLGCVV